MTPHRCVECRKVAHLALCCLSVARMLNYMSSRSVAVRFYVIHVIYRNDECIALVPFSSLINSCHLARSVIPFEVAVLSAWPASVHINRISSCRSCHVVGQHNSGFSSCAGLCTEYASPFSSSYSGKIAQCNVQGTATQNKKTAGLIDRRSSFAFGMYGVMLNVRWRKRENKLLF